MTPRAELRDAIFRSGKSQTEIAARTGINETKLSKIVRGWREPSPRERKAIARALRLPETELFPESDSTVQQAVAR